ncbi:hypothetical protein [Jiangella asiatica]|uniref:Uncharacterized protein n=1 Tax=Jiangella asiatica TaxID=2530372 RepID=A0A4R5CN70_9ACTN|nr:hypothetical protein [Jiangella asiatica]TDE00787.1 hypothetical protein E1269_24615 [Jiangella asiatica]
MWRNVPLPETHLAAIATGLALHRGRRWILPLSRRRCLGAGVVVTALGLGTALRSVAPVGRR